jgi:hypothetical protein
MLPRRGDLRSPAITALAVACFLAFWSLLVWGPIGAVLVAVFTGHPVVLALAACAGCVVAAFLARLVGHGIVRGHRAAYAVVCLLMLGATAFHVWRAYTHASNTALFAASRAAVFFCLALFVAALTVRKGSTNA